jgi:hypothetical protein
MKVTTIFYPKIAIQIVTVMEIPFKFRIGSVTYSSQSIHPKFFLMDTAIQDFIKRQPADRQKILSNLHALILKNDKTVMPVIEPMMGKEMIIYKGKKMMKYGLASMKEYMSLHALPIYMNPALHSKYQSLLDKASFQKGCINFTSAEQMPNKVITQFITECSAIDLEKIREQGLLERKASKKTAAPKKGAAGK